MAMETTALLRAILYQLKKSESLQEAISAVSVMCSKDDIAAVDQELKNLRESLQLTVDN